MKFEIEYCHDKINPKWDAFVNDVDGDIAQTSAWADFEFQYKDWRAIRFFAKTGETIVAGCQITIISDLLLGNIGFIQYGPCFRLKTSDTMNLMVSEMKKNIQILNLSYLIVAPNFREHDLVSYLENEGFELRYPNIPPFRDSTYRSNTLLLDLTLSTDDLLKQMTKMRRRGIQKGLNSPFKVKFGGRDDLKYFYDELYISTTLRHPYTDPVTGITRNWYPLVESCDELYKLWDALSPDGWVKLFLGIVDDEVICGALTCPFGKIFRYFHWGWNKKYSEYHISDAIQWEMIQWAKANGFQQYDFVSVNPVVAEAFYSAEPVPDDVKALRNYGTSMFKLHFGGSLVNYPGLYVRYSDKMRHLKETSDDELAHLLKLYKNFYWGTLNFFRDHSVNFN